MALDGRAERRPVPARRPAPSNRVIFGIGLPLFFAVLLGCRAASCDQDRHVLVDRLQPVRPDAVCPAGKGAWLGFLIGGIFLVLIGAAIAGSFALMVPVLFMAIGAGSITVAFDKGAASGSILFGLIFGGCFFVSGLVPAVFVLRSCWAEAGHGRSWRRRRRWRRRARRCRWARRSGRIVASRAAARGAAAAAPSSRRASPGSRPRR